jgi:hypothetical protein
VLRRRSLLIAATLALLASWANVRPAQSAPYITEATEATLIPAAPEKGFQFPYLLRLPPAGKAGAPPFLLVEPNNTGQPSTHFEEHLRSAMNLAKNGVGSDVARNLGIPFLIPVFPRPTEPYTQSLSRQTLLTACPRLHRLDLQLLAMIADARHRLAKRGIEVNQRVFLTGFSASGMFVTRFAALHPCAVQALAAGGVNGFVILPIKRLGATRLPFPVGVADLSSVADDSFNAVEWRQVAQFIFMGSEDKKDAVKYIDAYPPNERKIIYEYLGAKMLPDRWEKCQQLYREAGASASIVKFKTYPGICHESNEKINAEIANFFLQASHSIRQ